MTSGADIAKLVEKQSLIDDAYNRERQNVIKDINERADVIEKVIFDNGNPSPFIVALCIVLVLLGMYMIYWHYMKPCASGNWIDDSGVEYTLDHNKLDGRLNATAYKKNIGVNTAKGEINDNYVVIGEVPGVWDYVDNIMLFNGVVMKRYKS